MNIKSSTKNYNVEIGKDFQSVLDLEIDDKTFVVIDKNVYRLFGERFFDRIPKEQRYILDAQEENKTVETALEVCEAMTNIRAKRNARLVSFGGGIVQDVTGFAANILYRGVQWIFFPTTLLAACDSCIGGKTSLNYKTYKNLLGIFYPPDKIYVCTSFFKTLSERDFKSGLGEVVKFNVMSGKDGLQKMEEHIDALLAGDEAELEEFVASSLLFKKDFIEEDEFDRGVRVKLNFAHTFGHAFETVSGYVVPHGTAVAMGTVVADRISLSRGWMAEDTVRRIEDVLWKIIHVDPGCMDVDLKKMIDAIHKDKKQVGDSLTAVLMDRDWQLRIVHDVTREEIYEAVGYLVGKLARDDQATNR